jgi:hypothetical protein
MHLRIFIVLYLKAIHFSRILVLMVHCCYHKIAQDAENKVYKLIWNNNEEKKINGMLTHHLYRQSFYQPHRVLSLQKHYPVQNSFHQLVQTQ